MNMVTQNSKMSQIKNDLIIKIFKRKQNKNNILDILILLIIEKIQEKSSRGKVSKKQFSNLA